MARRTFANLVSIMQHGTGVSADARTDPYQTINTAGKKLTRERKWWHNLVPGVSLPAVISSANITLPSDFDSLGTIKLANGQGNVETLTPEEYTRLISGITSGYVVCGTRVLLPISTFDATTGAETKVLKLLSAATANGSPTFLLTYWRGWRDVDVDDAEAVPAIPSDFDEALMWACRACARDLQEQAESHEMVRYLSEVQKLKDVDTARTPEFAPARGGAMDVRRIELIGPLTFP